MPLSVNWWRIQTIRRALSSGLLHMFLLKFSTPLPQLSGKSFWFRILAFSLCGSQCLLLRTISLVLCGTPFKQKWSLGSRLHSLPNAFREFSIQRRKRMADFPKNYCERYKVPYFFFRSSKRPHRPVAGKIHQKPAITSQMIFAVTLLLWCSLRIQIQAEDQVLGQKVMLLLRDILSS